MFFSRFPKIGYDINADGNVKVVPDIFRRIKMRDKIKDEVSLLDAYDVNDNEKPEDVAYKMYGDADYYWVVLMMNQITNRYFDWPLSNQAFESYVKEKYTNPAGIHHYEKTQTSGTQTGNGPADFRHCIEVNADEPGATSVSNYEYEQRLQDQKRQIKVLNPNYLSAFIKEFDKLVRR